MKESKPEFVMANKESAILKSNIRLPYDPKTIDAFLEGKKWCRTSKFNLAH